MMLRYIPLGTLIHNIEMKKGKGAQLVRSAGSGGMLMMKDGDYAKVRPAFESMLKSIRWIKEKRKRRSLAPENPA